jgi:glycosyltransferase involved in cell wall biosynthesis
MVIRSSIKSKAGRRRANLLCVANFPANTGYAWDFIEGLYAEIANHFQEKAVETFVAYPAILDAPRTLRSSAAKAVCLDISLRSIHSIYSAARFVRRNDVRVVYFSDRPAWNPLYVVLRVAGVRKIIVHDHTSGRRTVPKGLKRTIKWLLVRFPGFLADTVIAVSDYVAHRQVNVGLVPSTRVFRVWHGVSIPPKDLAASQRLRKIFGLKAERQVIMCACRATPEKGVAHLMQAFEHMLTDWPGPRPVLIYVGEGPQMDDLRSLHSGLRTKKDIHLAGYRADVASLIGGADVCVVPSVWEEAFGLSVVEPMASAVGGIPEIIEHGVTGLLVPPADELALGNAMRLLCEDTAMARRLGAAARQRVIRDFLRERQLRELIQVVENAVA